MKAIEINQHLNALIPDLHEKTVDRVIYGNPEVEVQGIAVAWMPYRDTVLRAGELSANVMVTHEPTFYDHWDLDGKLANVPESMAKRELIEGEHITIIRCHDVWDALPDIGIPFAWGDFLELGPPVGGERFYNVYEVPTCSAREFTLQMSEKTRQLGQPTLGFYGDPDRQIQRVGLGTGCISNPFTLYEMGADLAISVDDVVRAWVAGEWCHDTGNPLVVVNHCVAEEPGMVTLANYLQKTFSDLPIHHIPQECTYQSIGN